MFSRKIARTIILSAATLVAAPSIAPTVITPAEAHAKRQNTNKKGSRPFQRKPNKKQDKRRDQLAKKSIKRTRVVLRAALRSVKNHDDGKGQLAGAVLHQRAAVMAYKKGHPRAALWLTRKARQQARDIIRDNKGEMPAGGRDHVGEWLRADSRDAPRFIELARRMPKKQVSPQVKEAMGKTRELVEEAAKAARTGGKEKDKLRKAMVQQKAARKAAKHGKDQVAMHLTGQARQAARAVIEANGGSTEDTGTDAETTGDATGSEEFTADAEADVATDIDPATVEDEADDEIDDEIDADLDDEDEGDETTGDDDA